MRTNSAERALQNRHTMKPVLQADPKAGYLAHKTEIDAAVAAALDSGSYILGSEVAGFEADWAAWLGVADAIGVGNGTDAIELALRALGVRAGDTVITTSNTAVATVAAIELTGASALLVDVDEATLTLSPTRLEEALATDSNGRIKAIIPVHLYGHPADMVSLQRIASAHRLAIVEDCAQAHGATIAERKVGTWGDMAAFSFYPTKNLAAFGDAGAVATNDRAIAERARALRVYGWKKRYISETAGMNSRLDDLQAAILRVKLRHLEADNARRIRIAQQYDRALSGSPVVLPPHTAGVQHVYHQYVIRLRDRDGLREHLKRQQIATAILYPVPIHQQPAYRDRIALAGDLAVTEKAASDLLCLPIHPWLQDHDVARVCESVLTWLNR